MIATGSPCSICHPFSHEGRPAVGCTPPCLYRALRFVDKTFVAQSRTEYPRVISAGQVESSETLGLTWVWLRKGSSLATHAAPGQLCLLGWSIGSEVARAKPSCPVAKTHVLNARPPSGWLLTKQEQWQGDGASFTLTCPARIVSADQLDAECSQGEWFT